MTTKNNQQKSYNLDVIGIIHSPYNEKFCIPRQSALNNVVKAKIELLPPYNCQQVIKGLENVSHLWVEFIFHDIDEDATKLMVRPPRLGGNKKIGVLATRSPFRKNRLGLSVVKLEQIIIENGRYFLAFSGVDMLDKTPVLDIKPYLEYSDKINGSNVGYVTEKVEKKFTVQFTSQVLNDIENIDNMKQELMSILCYDPRPAYLGGERNIIKFKYRNYDIVCLSTDKTIIIESVK